MPVATSSELIADRSLVDEYLTSLLSAEVVSSRQSRVQQAMHYAVLGSAQRIRPILALRVARLLHAPAASTLRAAAAVELLHCASLIVDDLPCMDNSPTRRNKPSVHVKFGEATAVLAAFALVALSARIVSQSENRDEDQHLRAAFQARLLRTLDCCGLIDGQAMDLHLDGSNAACSDVMELKTVPLFQLAVHAATTFTTIDENERALLTCFGREFGLTFQITDDLLDGEIVGRSILAEKLMTLRAVVAPFGPRRRPLEELIDYLQDRVSELDSK